MDKVESKLTEAYHIIQMLSMLVLFQHSCLVTH